MKQYLQKILSYMISLYFITAVFIFTPYYNWNYAKTHGFARWLFFGEVVATAKSFVWPYYIFSSHANPHDSPDQSHFSNSKKAYDEALGIVNDVGDVTKLPTDVKAKVAGLLRLAVAEANQVQPLYLQEAHPDYPNMYETKYKNGMSVMLQGIETANTALVLEGAYKCNEFSDWIHAHKSEFSR
jgi:hypothetical protein